MKKAYIPGKNCKEYFVLIDPQKNVNHLRIVEQCNRHSVSGIMIGGSSTVIEGFSDFVSMIRSSTDLPLILFPGSHYQVDCSADAIFLLSLLNSKNTKYLIGEHLSAAKQIYNSNLDIITTAYLIITDNMELSVARESKMIPLRQDMKDKLSEYYSAASIMKFDILYLEAGSGADKPLSASTVKNAKSIFKGPVVTGGGIRTVKQAREILDAGSDCIVTGNIVESKPYMIGHFMDTVREFNENI